MLVEAILMPPCIIAVSSRQRASAHGDLGQFLTGDPGRLTAAPRASALSSGTLPQQFFPIDMLEAATNGLQPLDVCVNAVSKPIITLTIRSRAINSPASFMSTTGVLSRNRGRPPIAPFVIASLVGSALVRAGFGHRHAA